MCFSTLVLRVPWASPSLSRSLACPTTLTNFFFFPVLQNPSFLLFSPCFWLRSFPHICVRTQFGRTSHEKRLTAIKKTADTVHGTALAVNKARGGPSRLPRRLFARGTHTEAAQSGAGRPGVRRSRRHRALPRSRPTISASVSRSEEGPVIKFSQQPLPSLAVLCCFLFYFFFSPYRNSNSGGLRPNLTIL